MFLNIFEKIMVWFDPFEPFDVWCGCQLVDGYDNLCFSKVQVSLRICPLKMTGCKLSSEMTARWSDENL